MSTHPTYLEIHVHSVDGHVSAFAQSGMETVQKLIEQMQKLTPEEAQDQVHRRFEHKICPKCQRKFLANPLGKPRGRAIGEN